MARVYETTTLWALCERWAAGEILPWEHNRAVDEARAERIAAALRAQKAPDLGPMPVIVAELGAGSLLVDGQHRLAAGRRLDAAVARRVEVLLCRAPCAGEAAVRELFRLANCGTPVPMAFYDADVARFTRDIARAVAARWPGAESFAPRPQRPRFSREGLVGALGESPAAREGAAAGRLDADAAFREVEAMNAEACAYFTSEITGMAARKAHKLSGNALVARAKTVDFYVGLYVDWPQQLMARLAEGWRAQDEE